LFKLLFMRVWRARQVLLLKKQLIEKNLKNNLLPFLGSDAGDGIYMNPDLQSYAIGFVGLNEMVKLHTGFGLGEDDSSKDFGLDVVGRLNEMVSGMQKESGVNFVLAQTPSMKCSKRLCEIDQKKFKSRKFTQYTNSFHPSKQKEFGAQTLSKLVSPYHKLCYGGALTQLPAKEFASPNHLFDSIKEIVDETQIQAFSYI